VVDELFSSFAGLVKLNPSVHVTEIKPAVQRFQPEFPVHSFNFRAQPLAMRLPHVLRDVRTILSNQQIFLKARDGLIR
jgi:hypothetical protein